MDDEAQAQAYAESDFVAVNQGFVDRFLEAFPDLRDGRVLDLGCGPADIPLRLCRALPEVEVVAVDGSEAMLALARKALRAAGRVGERVTLELARLPDSALPDRGFDAVISNSLLHHLPEPAVLWAEVRRLAMPGAPILIMDLVRPRDELSAQAIVANAGCSEDPLLIRDFYNSLLAAFTLDEVRGQLRDADLAHLDVAQVSERHLLVSGRL